MVHKIGRQESGALPFLIFLSLFTAFIFGGCNPEKKTDCIEIDINAALEEKGHFLLSDLVKEVEIITLDTVSDAFFGNMISLDLTDHYIAFTCDQQKKAYLFDRQGKFICNPGRKGKGPGEFREPNTIAVSPDEKFVVVGDPWLKKLILFDINGHFIRERVIKDDSPAWRFEAIRFADNTSFYVVFNRPATPAASYATVLQYDLNLMPVRKILPRPENARETSLSFSYFSLITNQDGFCFWEAGKDTVYYIDKRGETRPVYHLGIKDHCYDMGYERPDFYSSGKMNLCTMAMRILDLPCQLLIYIIQKGGSRTILFDKKSKKAFAVDQPIACDTANRSWVKTSVINDVFGLEPVFLSDFNPQRNELITLVRPGWTIDSHDMACVRQREVKFPAIRDRLATLAESRLGFENMAIVVMKLK